MYSRGKMKPLLSVFALVACVATGLIAQDISGTIGGTILDPSGAMVPNAKVTITNTDRNQVVRVITTDATGSYSAPLIPVGTYSVRVEVKGFKAETRTAITLNVSDDLKINVTLQVGSMSDTVTVEASALNVELGTAASANTINGEQVRELSIATRNYAPSGTAATLPYSINGNRTSITLNVSDDLKINVTLQVGSMSDTVTLI